MNEVSSSEEQCDTQTKQRLSLSELTKRPVIIRLEISFVDWDRLKRYVRQIPGTGRGWRDLAFAGLGMLIPMLLAALGLPYTSANLPECLVTINWVAVGILAVMTLLSFVFARTRDADVHKTVSEVLQEMEIIEIHSPRVEGRVESEST